MAPFQALPDASQANMFGGQQQGFGQPRPAQPDFRQMAGNPRAPYLQQAPNVTMNTNMGAMGGMGSQARLTPNMCPNHYCALLAAVGAHVLSSFSYAVN
ncbi:hypothetical protein YQE_07551, partial [Dendroctonus ponderosae]